MDQSPKPDFFKARGSGAEGGSCVEVAWGANGVLVRDSKDKSGPVLEFSYPGWRQFIQGVRAGEFEPTP